MKRLISTLTFKVLILIILAVLPLNVFLIFSTVRTTEELYRQTELSLQNTADLYVNTLDIEMENADYYLYSQYTNNPNFSELCRSLNKFQFENAKYRCIQEMQKELAANSGCDAYFFYLESMDEYVIGNAPEIAPGSFENFLRENLDIQRRWKICTVEDQQYLVRMTKLRNVYYGAFLNLDSVKKEILSFLNYESAEVNFSQTSPVRNEGKSIVYAESEKAGMCLAVSVDRKEIGRNLSWWEQSQILIAVLFLGMLPILYVAIRHWMILPLRKLNRAHHELEIGNEEYRITDNGNSEEFQEAYGSFNAMADNIHSLKVENMEKELARKELQLNNLQLQIRPHFLLNTFNLIFNLASEKRIDEVRELILYLSAYFRHIFRSGKDMEMFSRELQLIEGYIKAAKIRYPGKISFVSQIDPDIYLMRVPPLLLHNFIENIVKHAMVEERGIHIMLTGDYEDRKVIFNISDDGKGMSEKEVEMINTESYMNDSSGNHVGLKNSAMRLKFFYGEDASIRVESELGEGTVFVLTIPYNLEEEE